MATFGRSPVAATITNLTAPFRYQGKPNAESDRRMGVSCRIGSARRLAILVDGACLGPKLKPGANTQVKRQAWSTWQQSHSFLATSGPVIRSSSGKVAAITASDAASPARTMV
jgi:hypothetical protein